MELNMKEIGLMTNSMVMAEKYGQTDHSTKVIIRQVKKMGKDCFFGEMGIATEEISLIIKWGAKGFSCGNLMERCMMVNGAII
jgi:hypothetical protein